jgi:hypothetical protein
MGTWCNPSHVAADFLFLCVEEIDELIVVMSPFVERRTSVVMMSVCFRRFSGSS